MGQGGAPRRVARSETKAWLEHTIKDKSALTLGIVVRESGKLVGYVSITGISAINRAGEYFILIGDKSAWGKSIGREVTRLIVDHGFAALNLHRIMLTFSDLNIGGVKVYQAAGFREEVLRQACYRDGAYHDKIVMAVLRSEWEADQVCES